MIGGQRHNTLASTATWLSSSPPDSPPIVDVVPPSEQVASCLRWQSLTRPTAAAGKPLNDG